MPENLFSNSPAVWIALAAGLLAIPVLIHLINRLRYRRVPWAAMEFLRISQRKNRHRLWLKQLLLLLARMAILSVLLLMFSHLGCRDTSWTNLLGRGVTHHYLLLDDSLSMSASDEAGTSGLERARQTALKILERAQGKPGQLLSVLRWSQIPPPAETAVGDSQAPPPQWNWQAQLLDRQTQDSIVKFLESLPRSALAAGPEPVADIVEQAIRSRPDETAIVYWLSDFRHEDWRSDHRMPRRLESLREVAQRIELLRCDTVSRENLAIRQLRPVGNVRAVQVPIPFSITVDNFGQSSARNITVSLNQRPISSPDGKQIVQGDREPLPNLFIEEIPPGGSVTRIFNTAFAEPGSYLVRAELPTDPLREDNLREAVVSASPARRVLVLEGPTGNAAAPFLERALGAKGLTGIAVETRPLDYLRDPVDQSLEEYDVILVSAVASLDQAAVGRLEGFVERGGGLAWFLGPELDRAFFEQSLYRGGQGLFSVPLAGPVEIPSRGSEDPPDVVASQHPLLAALRSLRNSPLDLVQIKRVYVPAPEWRESREGSTEPARDVDLPCTLRGDPRRPLIVLDRFGRGRTALVMTTAAPTWNNWARNPTFVVVAMLLQDHLAAGRYPDEDLIVGRAWRWPVHPGDSETLLLQTPVTAERPGESVLLEPQSLEGGGAEFCLSRDVTGRCLNDEPGVYAVTVPAAGPGGRTTLHAVGVDCTESSLETPTASLLTARFGKQAQVLAWDEFHAALEQVPASPLTRVLLVLVGGLLLAESALVYLNSYHPRSSP